MNDSPVDCQSRERDKAKNATGRRFCARRNENKVRKGRDLDIVFGLFLREKGS